MQDLEGAISEAKERLSKLDKLWPSRESRILFQPKKILCLVDANVHSADAIRISIQLSQEFDTSFSIRSLFDKELLKLTDTDLAHLKETIIEIVKDNLRDTGLNKGITFLEGDAIDSINQQLVNDYDIFVLPVPYHSNLSDHPDAVALGSLGEYLVTHMRKPLFLVPELDEKKDDLFSSVTIVVNDISDIIQNQNYIRGIIRNRSHIHFVYLYDATDIDNLAESSKGVVDAELVKKRIKAKLEQYGKHTVEQFEDYIEKVEYSIYDGQFSDNIQDLNKLRNASLLVIILPKNEKGYRYLLFQDLLRDKRINIPILILRVQKEEDEIIEDVEREELEEDTNGNKNTEDDDNNQSGKMKGEEKRTEEFIQEGE